jgi:hypothetical protein
MHAHFFNKIQEETKFMEKAIKKRWPIFVPPTLIAFLIGSIVTLAMGI